MALSRADWRIIHSLIKRQADHHGFLGYSGSIGTPETREANISVAVEYSKLADRISKEAGGIFD